MQSVGLKNCERGIWVIKKMIFKLLIKDIFLNPGDSQAQLFISIFHFGFIRIYNGF